ncbi:hypothetical protein [Streptomyces sp. H27-C3]|uniref:hypothetical protein n=1 Tax=Streptomyces sp. H27-C3 TaxID=3046305 RepID=UPI0024BBE7C5|nr:hypothetical protein [Streptomyces sp. H27-C3]MDJ0466642.1 hypothetical protein [Streptomyces sp. H27-C3]
MIENVDPAKSRKTPYAFQYQVPDEFVRLPEPTASAGWREAMTELMPEADEQQLDAASAQIRDQLPRMSAQETTVLTAMCVGSEEVDGDERLSMGLLVVSVKPSEHRDRLLAAEGIYRAKEQKFFAGESDLLELDYPLGKGFQGRQDMVLAAKLPSGPAVMSTSLRSLTLPAADAGLPRPVIAMASVQLVIPAPRDYCVYVTIATPSVFLLDSYCGRLAHIGRTFTFDVEAGVAAEKAAGALPGAGAAASS